MSALANLAQQRRATLLIANSPSPRRFANRVFSYFLALTFLILPSVSIKIFST